MKTRGIKKLVCDLKRSRVDVEIYILALLLTSFERSIFFLCWGMKEKNKSRSCPKGLLLLICKLIHRATVFHTQPRRLNLYIIFFKLLRQDRNEYLKYVRKGEQSEPQQLAYTTAKLIEETFIKRSFYQKSVFCNFNWSFYFFFLPFLILQQFVMRG